MALDPLNSSNLEQVALRGLKWKCDACEMCALENSNLLHDMKTASGKMSRIKTENHSDSPFHLLPRRVLFLREHHYVTFGSLVSQIRLLSV